MKSKIIVCFALSLGGCISISHHGSGTFNAGTENSIAPQATPPQSSGTVMECIYQHGCYPLSP